MIRQIDTMVTTADCASDDRGHHDVDPVCAGEVHNDADQRQGCTGGDYATQGVVVAEGLRDSGDRRDQREG